MSRSGWIDADESRTSIFKGKSGAVIAAVIVGALCWVHGKRSSVLEMEAEALKPNRVVCGVVSDD